MLVFGFKFFILLCFVLMVLFNLVFVLLFFYLIGNGFDEFFVLW